MKETLFPPLPSRNWDGLRYECVRTPTSWGRGEVGGWFLSEVTLVPHPVTYWSCSASVRQGWASESPYRCALSQYRCFCLSTDVSVSVCGLSRYRCFCLSTDVVCLSTDVSVSIQMLSVSVQMWSVSVQMWSVSEQMCVRGSISHSDGEEAHRSCRLHFKGSSISIF